MTAQKGENALRAFAATMTGRYSLYSLTEKVDAIAYTLDRTPSDMRPDTKLFIMAYNNVTWLNGVEEPKAPGLQALIEMLNQSPMTQEIANQVYAWLDRNIAVIDSFAADLLIEKFRYESKYGEPAEPETPITQPISTQETKLPQVVQSQSPFRTQEIKLTAKIDPIDLYMETRDTDIFSGDSLWMIFDPPISLHKYRFPIRTVVAHHAFLQEHIGYSSEDLGIYEFWTDVGSHIGASQDLPRDVGLSHLKELASKAKSIKVVKDGKVKYDSSLAAQEAKLPEMSVAQQSPFRAQEIKLPAKDPIDLYMETRGSAPLMEDVLWMTFDPAISLPKYRFPIHTVVARHEDQQEHIGYASQSIEASESQGLDINAIFNATQDLSRDAAISHLKQLSSQSKSITVIKDGKVEYDSSSPAKDLVLARLKFAIESMPDDELGTALIFDRKTFSETDLDKYLPKTMALVRRVLADRISGYGINLVRDYSPTGATARKEIAGKV